MKILAIESSSNVASVAIMDEEKVIAEYTTDFKLTHSQTLLPMTEEIIRRTGTDKKSIDCIAISKGPGSFTGLRIGSATAKGLALALDIPIAAVPTVEAMAMNFSFTEYIVVPIMDARRDQVYTGIYDMKGLYPVEIMKQSAMSVNELIEKINSYGKDIILLGDGTDRFADIIKEGVLANVILAPSHKNRQKASLVGALGIKMFKEGDVESSDEHKPEYLRLSQAERELKEKQSNDNIQTND